MDTAITSDPPASRPPELHPQLIYTLDRWDYLTWWMCQWDRDHPPGSRLVSSRLTLWLFWVPLLLLGPAVMVGMVGEGMMSNYPTLRPLSVFGAIAVFVLWVRAVPRTCAPPVWRRLARDHHLSRMQEKAQDMQLSEVIHRQRIHWFLPFPEGFQEATELRRKSSAGIEDYQFRVVSVPWVLLRDVVVHERHIFLVGPGEDVWIIPKRCFADAAAIAEFLDTVHYCRRAATLAPVGAIMPAVENPEGVRAGEAAR